VVDPKVITYEFDEALEQLFERTLTSITSMSYARYVPSIYIHELNQIKELLDAIMGVEL
jgi:hypothetical protein